MYQFVSENVQEFRILEAAGAELMPPVLRDECWDCNTWEVLQERWKL